MLKRQSKYIAVTLLLVVALILACSPKTLELKPEEEANRVYYENILDHATATKKFAEAVMKYNLHYNTADEETKTFLRSEVDPLWVQASNALDAWEVAIKSGQSGEDEIMTYKRLKSQLLLKLPDMIWSD
jgi:hypothetical protein